MDSNVRRSRIEGGIGRFDVEGRLSDDSLRALDRALRREAKRKTPRFRLHPDYNKTSHKKGKPRRPGAKRRRPPNT